MLPIYFIYKSIKEKKYKIALIFISIFIIYFTISLLLLKMHHKTQEHLQNIPLIYLLLNYILHWFESLLTILFPIPFFINIPHFIFYIIGIALLIIFILISKNKKDEKILDENFINLIFIVFLLSCPTIITPELRIVGLESFFILILLILFLVKLDNKVILNKIILYISLTIIIISYTISIQVTKYSFKTDYYDPKKIIWVERIYYPNNYYEKKREVLINIYKAIKKK